MFRKSSNWYLMQIATLLILAYSQKLFVSQSGLRVTASQVQCAERGGGFIGG